MDTLLVGFGVIYRLFWISEAAHFKNSQKFHTLSKKKIIALSISHIFLFLYVEFKINNFNDANSANQSFWL